MSGLVAYRTSLQLKESRYETSGYPSISNRRLRCPDDNGSKRRRLRGRSIPGGLRGARPVVVAPRAVVVAPRAVVVAPHPVVVAPVRRRVY
jgi:hypothetical protein